MRYILLILSLFVTGCGSIALTPNGHVLFYKSTDGQLSCYKDSCCYPYKEKVMVCTEASTNTASVIIKVIPEK